MSMVVGGISLDFAGITPNWNENLPYEHTQVGQSRKVEYYFLMYMFMFWNYFQIWFQNVYDVYLHRHSQKSGQRQSFKWIHETPVFF